MVNNVWKVLVLSGDEYKTELCGESKKGCEFEFTKLLNLTTPSRGSVAVCRRRGDVICMALHNGAATAGRAYSRMLAMFSRWQIRGGRRDGTRLGSRLTTNIGCGDLRCLGDLASWSIWRHVWLVGLNWSKLLAKLVFSVRKMVGERLLRLRGGMGKLTLWFESVNWNWCLWVRRGICSTEVRAFMETGNNE